MNTRKGTASPATSVTDSRSSWAQICAGLGAASWAAIAVLARAGIARIGAIELMFLFAPLVIVPIGMELGLRFGGREQRVGAAARKLQPLGAALAIVSVCLPPGTSAAALASGWMLVCALAALSGVMDMIPAWRPDARSDATPSFSLLRFTLALARIDLAVGGAWLVASRLGMRPMGIQEPIGLLTAVHFHFAGFATATIAAATLHFAESRGSDRWLHWVVTAVVVMPYVIAIGFVTTSAIKMAAGVAFSISVAALAVLLRSYGGRSASQPARVLLQIAAVSVFAGMMLAAVFAIADFRGSDLLPIPQMARTHGILNAVGFCMCGLLGWVIEVTP